MKKILLASAFALLATGPALAQGDNDFLALTGTIDYNCDATLLGQTTSSVNMKISSQQPLGQIRYVCNDAEGFKLTVSSNNAGVLKNGTYTRNYKLTQGDGDVAALAIVNDELAVPVVRNAVGFQVGAAKDQGSTHDLTLNLDGGGSPLPGGVALTDTITFLVDGL